MSRFGSKLPHEMSAAYQRGEITLDELRAYITEWNERMKALSTTIGIVVRTVIDAVRAVVGNVTDEWIDQRREAYKRERSPFGETEQGFVLWLRFGWSPN